jgi:hypothetical protein
MPLRYLLRAASGLMALALVSGVTTPGYGQATLPIPEPPPPARYEPQPPAVDEDTVWIPGHWRRLAGTWVWSHGHWATPPFIGARWINGDWVERYTGWVWLPGQWIDPWAAQDSAATGSLQ